MNALLFKISCFFYVFIYSCYLINICLSTKCDTSNQCLITDNYDESHEKEKYSYIRNSFEWSDLLTVVKKAQENYVPPKSKSCDCFLNQIKKDLKKWRSNGITFDMIETSKKFGVHYQIINHRLYREKNCKFPARCEGIEHFILQIINKLPDLELIINVNDWPQTMLHHTLPIFSFSKDDSLNGDILYPAWSFWCGGPVIEQHPTGIGRFDILRNQISEIEIKWKDKIDKVFFRGSRTSQERDWLIILSKSHPHILDAKYTKNQAWKSPQDTLGMDPAPVVSFADHCKYKYLINTRGVAASFRYKHLFLCRSLVFNIESNWIEFFYSELKPWVHYVPVTSENFVQRLSFLRSNENIAQKIALNGFNFIWNHIDLKSVECYWLNLLKEYHSLLKYKPKKLSSLVEIK